MRPLQVDAAAKRRAISQGYRRTVICKRENHGAEHDVVTTKQPRSESGGLCCFGAPALQGVVYRCRSFKSVRELKSAIVAAWQQLSQAFLDRGISERWRRLENVVQCNGRHV